MALSLPTTSNTPGSFSNTALSANLLSSVSYTSDFKHSGSDFTNGTYDLKFGEQCMISANGDYAIITTAAAASGDPGNDGGVVLVMSRSGNTWTQQAALTNQSSDSGSASDLYGNWSESERDKGISIDGAGETIIIGGSNRGSNNNAGRIEIWERSGSTWSMNYGLNGSSNDHFGRYAVLLADDGNSAIAVAHNGDSIKRLEKTGGAWGVDSTHGTYSIGTNYDNFKGMIAYNYNGTKMIFTGGTNIGTNSSQVKLATRYYDGSTWQFVEKDLDLSGTGNIGSANTRPITTTMSQDGNYAFVGGFKDTSGDPSWIAILSWDSSSNNWTQDTAFDPLSGISGAQNNRPGNSGPLLTNYTGTKLLAMNRPDYGSETDMGMYAWERSGSTWSLVGKFTEGGNLNQTSRSSGALSSDGLHLLHGIKLGHLTSPYSIGRVYYWVPTGIIQSSVSNGQIATHQGRRFRYNSAKQRWTPANKVNLTGVETTRTRTAGVASSDLSGETLSINGLTVDVGEFAGKTTSYANASIFPFSSLQAGDQAIALDTGYLYVTDGSGWFRVANSAIVT